MLTFGPWWYAPLVALDLARAIADELAVDARAFAARNPRAVGVLNVIANILACAFFCATFAVALAGALR